MTALANERVAYFNGKIVPESDVLVPFRDRGFMAGDAVSLADLMVAPHYYYLSLTPEGRDILGPHQRLRDWWQAMATRESIKKTEPKFG